MKKIFVLSAALAALVVFSGAASAFTMAELENGVKKYVQALNRSAEVRKTYCETDGSPLTNIADMGQYDSVRYVQGDMDSAVELRPAGGVLELVTGNPAYKLPDGSGVGDPIERVAAPAVVPGDYQREVKDGFISHMWVRDGIATVIIEMDAKIAAITYFNSVKAKGITLNEEYSGTLRSKDADTQQAAVGKEEPLGPEWNVVSFEKGRGDKTYVTSYDENFKEAIVYKERSLKSERVATLKRDTEVLTAEFVAREFTGPPDRRFRDIGCEVWVKITEPVVGWMVPDELGAWNSDVLVSFGLFDFGGEPAAVIHQVQEDQLILETIFGGWDFGKDKNLRYNMSDSYGKKIEHKRIPQNVYDFDLSEHGVHYFQGRDDVMVLFVMLDGMDDDMTMTNYVYLNTKNKNLNFPGGVKIGGGTKALGNGYLPGVYSVSNVKNGKVHQWEDDVHLFQIFEAGGKITNVSYTQTDLISSLNLRKDLMNYVK